jgi:hypothetical protein
MSSADERFVPWCLLVFAHFTGVVALPPTGVVPGEDEVIQA